MSPSSVSCGLRATWWLLDKFESHWIRWCIVLLLYAEWTTAFYRFSDVCRLSLTRYVNQIRADEVLNWVFCRWNFALCIFRQKTNQNESCLKVKVNRILKVKLMLVFLATAFKTAMRAWRRPEVKVSSCTLTDNLSQIRFNLCISVWTLYILWKEEIKSKVHKNHFAVLVLLSCSVKRFTVQSPAFKSSLKLKC